LDTAEDAHGAASLGGDLHCDPLHRVVRVALEVPGRLERLCVAAASVALLERTYSPSVACHSNRHPRHAFGPTASSSSASAHLAPASVETCTEMIGPYPDHARPVTVTGPDFTKRVRVMKSGTPGGTISERGSMRVTGSPGSPSAL
jgi:hypothetical protein